MNNCNDFVILSFYKSLSAYKHNCMFNLNIKR